MSNAFRATGATQTLAPANSSANADFAVGPDSFLITNNGDTICFVRVQSVTGAAPATAADVPVRAATAGIVDVPEGAGVGGLRVSVFSTGTITVYATPGRGGI